MSRAFTKCYILILYVLCLSHDNSGTDGDKCSETQSTSSSPKNPLNLMQKAVFRSRVQHYVENASKVDDTARPNSDYYYHGSFLKEISEDGTLSLDLDEDLESLVRNYTVARIRSPFAAVPLISKANNSLRESFLIRSIVPVADGAAKGLVAMIGAETNFSAGDLYTGRHLCLFPGSAPTFVEKKNATQKYRRAVVWQCALPPSVIPSLFSSGTASKCLNFSIISENLTNGELVVPLQTCHYPSVLAARATPYKLAMCQANLAQFTPTPYLHLPPWLEYHSRHGVDQFIMYVRAHRRNDMLKLLKPWLVKGLLSLVMVDDDPHYVPADMHKNFLIKSIKWLDGSPQTSTNDGVLINDCNYRLRHKAIWSSPQSDVDEYFVPVKGSNPAIVSPPDNSRPLLPQVLEPYLKDDKYYAVWTGMLWYEASEKPGSLIDLGSTHRQGKWAPKCFKSIVRPELVDVSWVHWPTNTKRGAKADARTVLRFNHYRLTADQRLANVTDEDFVDEAHEVQNAACLAFGLNRSCSPEEWLPEGMIASGPPTSTFDKVSLLTTKSYVSDLSADLSVDDCPCLSPL